MKKYVGAICSAVAGIFTFILLSLNWMTAKYEYASMTEKESVTGWDLMKDANDVKGFTLYKLAAIIMIIIAAVLIIAAVVLILQNLNILKFKFNLNTINNIILTVFVGFVVLAMIGVFVMAKDMSHSVLGMEMKCSAAIGAWFMAIVAVVTCATAWVMQRITK